MIFSEFSEPCRQSLVDTHHPVINLKKVIAHIEKEGDHG